MSKPCTITRATFHAHAQPQQLTLGDQLLAAMPREFSTASLGWFANGKAFLEVNGQRVPCQVSCTVTVIGSKDLPKDAQPVAA